MIREKVATFGVCGSLVGIVSEPETSVANKPAIIILNSGLVHRCGPFRIATRFSRFLAAEEYLTLRFDSSGIGDSPYGGGDKDYTGQLIQDVGHAITYLKRSHGVSQVVLFGICTGADNAHKATLVHHQIIGAIFVDGYAYKTPQFYFHRYAPLFRDIYRIGRAIMTMCSSFTSRMQKLVKQPQILNYSEKGFFSWKLPPKSSAINDLKTMIERKVELLYFFTAGSHRYCNYEGQFRDSFPMIDFEQQLEICFLPQVDHTFILSEDQQLMFAVVKRWLASRFV